MDANERTVKALAWMKDYRAMSLTAGFPRRCGRVQVRRVWGCAVCSDPVPKSAKVLKIETAPYVGAVLCGGCEFLGRVAAVDNAGTMKDGSERIVTEWIDRAGNQRTEVEESLEDARETAGRVLESLSSLFGAVQIRRQVFRVNGWTDAGMIEEVS